LSPGGEVCRIESGQNDANAANQQDRNPAEPGRPAATDQNAPDQRDPSRGRSGFGDRGCERLGIGRKIIAIDAPTDLLELVLVSLAEALKI
jgi:hypothetical protein